MEVELLEGVVLAGEREAAGVGDIDLQRVAIVDDLGRRSRGDQCATRGRDVGGQRAGEVDRRLLAADGAGLVLGGELAPVVGSALAAIAPVGCVGDGFGVGHV